MKKEKSALFLLVGIVLFSFFSVSFVYSLGTPTKISTTTTDDAVFPQTVTDSKGYLHMVWMEVLPIDCSGFDCTNVWGSYQNSGIFYSRWNGDTWSAPLKISANTGFAQLPSLAVDTTDTVHIVWDDTTYVGDGLQSVAYRTRSASGTLSAIEVLARPVGTLNSWAARVAVDNANVPHIVHTANTGGNKDSIYWTRKVLGAWTTPELISKDASLNNITDTQFADLRSDTSGNLYLTYWSWTKGIFYRKYSSAIWSTPFQVTGATVEFSRMTVTPAGEVFVIWFERSGTSVKVRWTQAGVWQSQLELDNNAHTSFWGLPIIGISSDSKERVNASWGVLDVGDNLIDLNFRVFESGGWSPIKKIKSDMSDADTPFVFRDKWDNQHFAWTQKNATSGLWEIFYSVVEGTTQTIGSAGGTITANPENVTYVTLDIPASALSNNQDIAIQIGPVPESVSPTQVTIPRSLTFRPNGLVFNAPKKATATITYTNAEVAGLDERGLKPWVWNSATNAWEAKNGTNNTNANTIKVDLTGFSLYGISAPIVNTAWISPTQNQVIDDGSLRFKFNLKYADGTEVVPPQSPDELTVKVKDQNNQIIQTLSFKPSQITSSGNDDEDKEDEELDEDKEDKDTKKKKDGIIYKGTLHFEKDDIPNGKYTLEVYLAGNLVGQQSFTLER